MIHSKCGTPMNVNLLSHSYQETVSSQHTTGVAASGYARVGHQTLARWLMGALLAIVLPSVLSVASAQSLTAGFVLNNTSVGNVNSSNSSGTVNWRTGDTGNAVISYSCGSGPCNGVVFTYQAAAPFSVWGVPGGVGVTTTPAAGTASRVASYTIDNATNRVTVTMNSLPSGTGSVTLNNIRSYGGSTLGQTATHTLTTATVNAGAPGALNVSVVTPQPTGTVVAAIASPTDVAVGETVNYTASLAMSAANTTITNSRAVVGPATITYTAPAGSNVISAPSICHSPLGAEFTRTAAAGFVGWTGSTTPAVSPNITGNLVSWSIPAGGMVRLCGVSGDGLLGTGNLLFQVQFPSANFVGGQAISSQLCINGFYPGGIATGNICGTRTGNMREAFLKTSIVKGRAGQSPAFPTVGDLDFERLTLTNGPLTASTPPLAPVTLNSWTIRDTVPPAARVTRLSASTFVPAVAPAVVAQWRYRLQSTGTWMTASTTGLTLDFCSLVAAVCAPTPTDWVLEWEFTWDSAVSTNQPVPPNQSFVVDMFYQLQAIDRNGSAVSVGQTFTNTATSDATSNAGTMAQATAQESFVIPQPNGGRWSTHGTSTATAGQSVTASSSLGVGNIASCSVDSVDNSIRGGAIGPMVDPVLLLTMPGDYAQGSYAVALSTQTVAGVPEPTRVVCSDAAGQDFTVAAPLVSMVTDYRGSGRVAAIARWPGVSIPRGCRIGDTSTAIGTRLLTLSATLASQTLAGSNVNGCLATIFSDQQGLSGHNASSASGPWELGGAGGSPVNVATVVLTDTFDQNGDGSTADSLRAANATLTVPSIPAIAGSKSWFNASGLPITTAERGQTLLTEIRLRNTGNDTLTDFTIVDVLPAAGDLNFSLAPRGSTTNAQLTGPITGLPKLAAKAQAEAAPTNRAPANPGPRV